MQRWPIQRWLAVALTGVALYPQIICMAAPTTRPAYPSPLDSKAERSRLAIELRSGNPSRVAAAVKEVRDGSLHHATYDMLLVDAGLYSDAEAASIEGTISEAADSNACGGFAEVRARALLADGKAEGALQAAKSCYNVCLLRKTADAIELVSDCLVAAYPDDPTIAARFKSQQMAWAAAQSSTSPSDGPDLGPPVLAQIHVDDSQFRKAIGDLHGLTFAQITAKGNLLLIVDQPKEARKLFDLALRMAKGNGRLSLAVENIARCIRAESGCVGPANAFIVSLEQGK